MDFAAPKLSFGAIGRPAFGRLAQHAEDKAPAALTTKARARRMMMLREARGALPDLPAPGETVHTIMSGNADLMLWLVAILDMCPARCRRLRIMTLTWNRRNAVELLGLLESGKIGALTLLSSDFHRSHYKPLYQSFKDDLAAFPGSRLASGRTHCKVSLFDFSDESGLVLEGSANLRTNSNREQLCIGNDRQLHDWYARFIEAMADAEQGDESRDRATG